MGEDGGREHRRGGAREAVHELDEAPQGVVEGAEEHPAGALLRDEDVERGGGDALVVPAAGGAGGAGAWGPVDLLVAPASPPRAGRGQEEGAPDGSDVGPLLGVVGVTRCVGQDGIDRGP